MAAGGSLTTPYRDTDMCAVCGVLLSSQREFARRRLPRSSEQCALAKVDLQLWALRWRWRWLRVGRTARGPRLGAAVAPGGACDPAARLCVAQLLDGVPQLGGRSGSGGNGSTRRRRRPLRSSLPGTEGCLAAGTTDKRIQEERKAAALQASRAAELRRQEMESALKLGFGQNSENSMRLKKKW